MIKKKATRLPKKVSEAQPKEQYIVLLANNLDTHITIAGVFSSKALANARLIEEYSKEQYIQRVTGYEPSEDFSTNQLSEDYFCVCYSTNECYFGEVQTLPKM